MNRIIKECIVVGLFMSAGLHLFVAPERYEDMNIAIDVSSCSLWCDPDYASLPSSCTIEKKSDEPYIVLIHNFITDQEAEHIKQLSVPRMKRSVVVDDKSLSKVHPGRTSYSASLSDVHSDIVNAVREKAAALLRTDIDEIESLQVVHYQDGQKYDPHFDYFDRSKKAARDTIEKRGQRVATLLVYLNDIPDGVGGETLFPHVHNGLKIKPHKNAAVLWFNVDHDGKEDPRTLHGGLPITAGEKWAINIWVRSKKVK